MLYSRLLESIPEVRHAFSPRPEVPDPKPWRPRQVHGAVLVDLTAPNLDPPEADGTIARAPGLPIGVVTADCIPLLFAHPNRVVVAAVHAGWRGLAAGILERTVEALEGPEGWRVALGPAAGGCCYEVGVEVLEALQPAASFHTATRPGHSRLDLRGVAVDRLLKAGVHQPLIEVIGPCTICSGGWPSYRRDGHKAGRMLSWIGRSL
ncbi:MAG: peptidoglycan editing factor PgeF [Acidobacteriota bacterium]